MINLMEEFAAAADNAERHAGWLTKQHGLPEGIVKPDGRAVMGLGRCRLDVNGAYAPADNGEKCLIIAEAQSHERWPRTGKVGIAEIIDLIAVPFAATDRWFLRCGMACLLGAENLEAITDKNPITVYATPMRWLQAGGNGICILNWRTFDRWYFANTFPLQFDSAELRQRFFERPQYRKAKVAA